MNVVETIYAVVANSRNSNVPVTVVEYYTDPELAQREADEMSYKDWSGPNEYYYTVGRMRDLPKAIGGWKE